jgi:hypothetical protein
MDPTLHQGNYRRMSTGGSAGTTRLARLFEGGLFSGFSFATAIISSTFAMTHERRGERWLALLRLPDCRDHAEPAIRSTEKLSQRYELTIQVM